MFNVSMPNASLLWKLLKHFKIKLKFLNSFLVLNVKINFSWNSISGNILYHINFLVIVSVQHITDSLYLCLINKSHKFSLTTINFQKKFLGSITQVKSKNHFLIAFFSSFREVFN